MRLILNKKIKQLRSLAVVLLYHKNEMMSRLFLKKSEFDYLLSTMRITNIIIGMAKYLCVVKSKIIFREPNTLDEILLSNIFVRNFYLI